MQLWGNTGFHTVFVKGRHQTTVWSVGTDICLAPFLFADIKYVEPLAYARAVGVKLVCCLNVLLITESNRSTSPSHVRLVSLRVNKVSGGRREVPQHLINMM